MSIQVKNLTDMKEVTASEALFGQAVNEALVAQAVRVYLSNQRQGTAKTKTRSEINRTHKKWFKQKGTGNARHGARNPNIFVGGGVAHGPNGEQNYTKTMPPKMKRRALVCALSWQASVITLSAEIEKLDGKTKSAAKLLAPVLANEARVLVVVKEITAEIRRSCANLEQVLVVTADRLNTLLVVQADQIVITPAAVESLEIRLSGEKSVTDEEKVTVKKVAAKKAAAKKENK